MNTFVAEMEDNGIEAVAAMLKDDPVRLRQIIEEGRVLYGTATDSDLEAWADRCYEKNVRWQGRIPRDRLVKSFHRLRLRAQTEDAETWFAKWAKPPED